MLITTLPPVQKVVAPCAVAVGVELDDTETEMALEVAEQPLLLTVRV